VVHHRWHPLNEIFVWLTKLGTHGLVWLALGLAVALVYRRVQPFVLVLLAVTAADGLASLAKAAIREDRPDGSDALIAVPHSHSFPSGHTATATAAAVVLSSLVPKAAPLFAVLAAAIAYSRLYLGVHFPLDVLGGAAIGAATALLLLAIARRRSAQVLPRAR
jgi:membrane-associated phospholipid phosphatase